MCVQLYYLFIPGGILIKYLGRRHQSWVDLHSQSCRLSGKLAWCPRCICGSLLVAQLSPLENSLGAPLDVPVQMHPSGSQKSCATLLQHYRALQTTHTLILCRPHTLILCRPLTLLQWITLCCCCFNKFILSILSNIFQNICNAFSISLPIQHI